MRVGAEADLMKAQAHHNFPNMRTALRGKFGGEQSVLGKTKLFNSGAVALFCEELNGIRTWYDDHRSMSALGGVLVASMMVA
jgi:hypothetical protein